MAVDDDDRIGMDGCEFMWCVCVEGLIVILGGLFGLGNEANEEWIFGSMGSDRIGGMEEGGLFFFWILSWLISTSSVFFIYLLRPCSCGE